VICLYRTGDGCRYSVDIGDARRIKQCPHETEDDMLGCDDFAYPYGYIRGDPVFPLRSDTELYCPNCNTRLELDEQKKEEGRITYQRWRCPVCKTGK